MSKLLYLVRHAKSSWSDRSLSDRDRPLNKRGRRSAPDMGRRLAAQDHLPELIISSPARRAFSTARKIARELGYDRSEIMKDESLYFSGTGAMLDLLESLDDSYQRVMIVGHNPAMTSLMNILSGSSIDNMLSYTTCKDRTITAVRLMCTCLVKFCLEQPKLQVQTTLVQYTMNIFE